MKNYLWIPVLVIALVGCTPKTNDGLLPAQPVVGNGVFPSPWVMYNDSLHTGGGYFLYPGVPPTQSANSADTALPKDGNDSFSYTLTDYGSYAFAGVIISNTPDYHNFGVVPGPDMSLANFTKVTFWAKANQTVTVTMSAAGGSDTNIPLTTQWAPCTITSLGDMTNVQKYFVIGVNNGQAPQTILPLKVNVDDIIYQ